MKKQLVIVCTLATLLTLQSGFTQAGTSKNKSTENAIAPTTDQEQIYGIQLMTPQECAAYRAKMSAAKTVEERQQLREENHQAMQERAKAQGVSLPDQPSASMSGGGMDQGGGKGAGRGRSQ